MAELTGSALYLKFGSTVLNSDYRTFEQEETGGVVDASAGADTNRTYLTTLKDGTGRFEGVYQASGSAVWTALAPTTSGTLEWGEEGTASGKTKHQVVALVTRRRKTHPYDNVIVIGADFQFNGAVTDTIYS